MFIWYIKAILHSNQVIYGVYRSKKSESVDVANDILKDCTYYQLAADEEVNAAIIIKVSEIDALYISKVPFS